MSEDIVREIDEVLADRLPANPGEHPDQVSNDQKQKIIQLLRYAAEEVGRSPSAREFDSLGLEVGARKIQEVFGSWNEAKQEAGLEAYEIGENKEKYLNQEYFTSIDSVDKAYWLGTIFATSSLRSSDTHSLTLNFGRSKEKDYFIVGLAKAVESDYSINSYKRDNAGSTYVSLAISDRGFIESIFALGYPDPDGSEYRLPGLEGELRAPFVRGFIESNTRTFTGNPMRIPMENVQIANTIKDWLEDFGVNRPTVTERKSDGVGVNISNEFNIKALFETLWPDGITTEPSFAPYPESILNYLQKEYPYPENVEYLSE